MEEKKEFPFLEASVGGEISIDIYPRGKNKAQVLDEITGPVVFFGDNKGMLEQRLAVKHMKGLHLHDGGGGDGGAVFLCFFLFDI